jgi:hypothetical protein
MFLSPILYQLQAGAAPIWTAAAYLDCAACSALTDYRMRGGAFVCV